MVTGGGSGIGLMAAQALAINGARVYIVGRTGDKLKAAAAVHSQNIAGEIIPLIGDVSDKKKIMYGPSQPQRLFTLMISQLLTPCLYSLLVKEIEACESCLHILVNNAGIFTAGQRTPSPGCSAEKIRENLFDTDTATFDDWEFIYRTNTASLYFMTIAFVPLLARAANDAFTPAVVNITSINGLIRRSLGHFAANSAKAAAIHVTKMLATELAAAGQRIRVNSVAPGVFPSEITTGKPADPVNANKSHLPAGSWGTAEIMVGRPGSDFDMAGAVLFVATNQYLHGQIISLDGGYLVQHGTL